MPIGKSTRVEHAFRDFRAGKNSRSGELVLVGDTHDLFNRFSSQRGSTGGGLIEIAGRQWTLARACSRGHGKQIRIGMLDLGQALRGLYNALQALLVEFVRCGSCGALSKR